MDQADLPLYLLDTPILVHYIREDALMARIEGELGVSARSNVLISVVTEGEIRALALKFAWGDQKLERLDSLLDTLTVVPIPFLNIIESYSQIDDFCQRHGFQPGKNDLWIAATANVTTAQLVTTDQDFDPLDGIFLKLIRFDPKV